MRGSRVKVTLLAAMVAVVVGLSSVSSADALTMASPEGSLTSRTEFPQDRRSAAESGVVDGRVADRLFGFYVQKAKPNAYKDPKVILLHPKPIAKGGQPPLMNPRFVAAFQVNYRKDSVKVNDDVKIPPGDISVKDAHGNKVPSSDLATKVLKSRGGSQNSEYSRWHILVSLQPNVTLSNPYTMKIIFHFPDNAGNPVTSPGEVTFAFRDHKPMAKPKEKPNVEKSRPLTDFTITDPPSGTHLSSDQQSYFVTSGTGDSILAYAKIGAASGVTHYDDTDKANPIWWAEFSGLDSIPGPGTYPISAAETDGDILSTAGGDAVMITID